MIDDMYPPDLPPGCSIGMVDRSAKCPHPEEAAPRKKRKKMVSPTSRTLVVAGKRGYVIGVVERFVGFPPPGHRVDLFGVIDLVGVRPTEDKRGLQIVGVQATSDNGGNHASRRAKILAEPRAKLWCDAGGALELWSWKKRGARWEPRIEVFTSASWPATPAGNGTRDDAGAPARRPDQR